MITKYNPTITGERLKYLRKEVGLTQEDIGRFLGYSTKSTISQIEKGDIELPSQKLFALCKLYGCSSDYLLGLSNQKKFISPYEKQSIKKKICKINKKNIEEKYAR